MTTIARVVVTLSDGTELDMGSRDSVVRLMREGAVFLNATLPTSDLLRIVEAL